MNKINVMHFRFGFLTGGGPEMLIYSLVQGIKRDNFHIFLVLWLHPKHNLDQYIEGIGEKGAHVEIIERRKCDPRVITDLISLMKKYNIHILHSHEALTDIVVLIAAKIRGITCIASSHGYAKSTVFSRFIELIDMLIIRFFDIIIVGSEAMKRMLKSMRVPKEKIRVIHNSIETDGIKLKPNTREFKDNFRINPDHKIIATVGRLSKEKGQEFLLKAVASVVKRLPMTRFLIVGHGRDRLKLENLVKELHISDYVIFTGYYPDISQVLAVCDLLVLSSLRESLPLIILEAMAASKPVIATKVGGVPEAITHEENGLLVNPGNSAELAEAIVYVLRDKNKALQMGMNGRRVVEERFSAEVMLRQIEKIYLCLYGDRYGRENRFN